MRGFLVYMIGEIRVAGPCAAESKGQMLEAARALQNIGVDVVRGCWWKPRTQPGWDGVGKKAAPWGSEITRMGMTVATEVLQPEHVIKVIKGIEENGGDPERVMMWLGSRNQNDRVQKAIGRSLVRNAPEQVKLLVKNQPWADEKHWIGIVKHLESVGLPPDRMIMVHRGFHPNGHDNPNGLRNIPDWEMVRRVKEQTGLPMLIDPSHIGGSVENVIGITLEASNTGLFDGFIIEAHPHPDTARTDAKQQLSMDRLKKLMDQIH